MTKKLTITQSTSEETSFCVTDGEYKIFIVPVFDNGSNELRSYYICGEKESWTIRLDGDNIRYLQCEKERMVSCFNDYKDEIDGCIAKNKKSVYG